MKGQTQKQGSLELKYNNQSTSSAKFQAMPRRTEGEIRKRIQSSGQVHELEELCLDGIEIRTITPNIRKLIEACTRLEYLTMNFCELESLDNFPTLRNLIGLELSDNRLDGTDLGKLTHCAQINFITLDNNNITSISSLTPLRNLTELEMLQVHDNPMAKNDHLYRETIFELILSLKSVDCIDRSGERVREDENFSDYITDRHDSYVDLTDLLFGEEGEEEEPNNFTQLNRHVLLQVRPIRQGHGALFDSSSDEDSEMGGPMIQGFKKLKKNE